MKTSKILLFLLISPLLFLGSCKQNLIEATQPKASKDINQAKKRLIATEKWTIDEFYAGNELVYKQNQNLPDNTNGDVDLEYISFKSDGVFEVKQKNEPLDTSLRYKIDDVKNTIQIYDPSEQADGYLEDWIITAGSVYSDSFEITMEESETYNGVTETILLKIKMIALK